MSDILNKIVATKHEEVALRLKKIPFAAMRADAESRVMTRGFEAALRAKMAAYQANGARLGWLLLPHEQAVEAWPASAPPQRLDRLQVLEATPEFTGLSLQLAEIWEG